MSIRISSAHMEVTSKCNLRCKYCYNSIRLDHQDTDLSFDSKKRVIDDLIDNGCTTFVFSGGEPFSYPDFSSLLLWMDETHPTVSYRILTNGTLVTEEIAESIASRKGAKEVRLSIDGFSNNQTRGNGVYNRALKGALNLVAAGLKVGINTVLTKTNLDECESFYDFLLDSGVYSWRVDTPFYCGAFVHNKKELGIDDIDRLFEVYGSLILKSAPNYKRFKFAISRIWHSDVLKGVPFNRHRLEEHPCQYHRHALTIRANGDVSFCPSWNRVFGNISSEGLLTSWDNICSSDFGQLSVSKLTQCNSCEYLAFCGGGCRSDVLYSDRELTQPDERTCREMMYLFTKLVPTLPSDIGQIYINSISKVAPQQYVPNRVRAGL